jgi:hypothetical protein
MVLDAAYRKGVGTAGHLVHAGVIYCDGHVFQRQVSDPQKLTPASGAMVKSWSAALADVMSR